jgi:ubiquinone/menaquinone biosynthesis C-methylase UbiE
MVHKFDPGAHHLLGSPERRRLQPADAALKAFGLARDQVFVDLGCGPGYFLIPAARRVKTAWGCDISLKMLDMARRTAAAKGLRNVRTLRVSEKSIPLPSGRADKVLLSNVLHELTAPVRLLREIRRILAPGGELLVIDWKKESCRHGPLLRDRIGRERARKMIEKAGFQTVNVLRIFRYRYQYALLARKTAAP